MSSKRLKKSASQVSENTEVTYSVFQSPKTDGWGVTNIVSTRLMSTFFKEIELYQKEQFCFRTQPVLNSSTEQTVI